MVRQHIFTLNNYNKDTYLSCFQKRLNRISPRFHGNHTLFFHLVLINDEENVHQSCYADLRMKKVFSDCRRVDHENTFPRHALSTDILWGEIVGYRRYWSIDCVWFWIDDAVASRGPSLRCTTADAMLWRGWPLHRAARGVKARREAAAAPRRCAALPVTSNRFTINENQLTTHGRDAPIYSSHKTI